MAFNNSNNSDDDIIADINLTPLIDIMLVLLIIFMVTSSVSLESGIDIDLPKTASETNSKESKVVIVSLSSNGKIFVEGKLVEGDLESDIRLALKSQGTDIVILEGDKASTLENAFEIIDIAKKAGANKLSIAAEGQ